MGAGFTEPIKKRLINGAGFEIYSDTGNIMASFALSAAWGHKSHVISSCKVTKDIEQRQSYVYRQSCFWDTMPAHGRRRMELNGRDGCRDGLLRRMGRRRGPRS